MKHTAIYIALCAIAIGNKIISTGQPLPDDVSAEKIKSLLANKSIEESVREVTASSQPENPKAPAATTATLAANTITGDGSGEALPDISNTEKVGKGITSEATATLTGVVTKDGRVVELNKLSAAALKKIATGLDVAGADQMKKEALVEAITAIEFAAE